jgi:hypothetical protein
MATARRSSKCRTTVGRRCDPALERFYQSLSDEQKARFNAIAPTDDANAAGQDQRDLAKFCDEKSSSVTDLPIDRIGQAVQPTPTQRAALDDLKDASAKATEGLKVSCPAYQMLTPTGRVEAMEKRLDATLGAVKTVQPALAKYYNSLSDEQKARFNSLRSASRRVTPPGRTLAAIHRWYDHQRSFTACVSSCLGQARAEHVQTAAERRLNFQRNARVYEYAP